MAFIVYKTYYITCPHCHVNLGSVSPFSKSYIGPVFAPCPNCGDIINTGKSEWVNKSKLQKAIHYHYILFKCITSIHKAKLVLRDCKTEIKESLERTGTDNTDGIDKASKEYLERVIEDQLIAQSHLGCKETLECQMCKKPICSECSYSPDQKTILCAKCLHWVFNYMKEELKKEGIDLEQEKQAHLKKSKSD